MSLQRRAGAGEAAGPEPGRGGRLKLGPIAAAATSQSPTATPPAQANFGAGQPRAPPGLSCSQLGSFWAKNVKNAKDSCARAGRGRGGG